MRVATWNVNGLRARLEFVLAWLEERKPDVVGLQELKMTDEQFPMDAFHDVGYQVQTHGQKAWNGVAILTSFRSQTHPDRTSWPGRLRGAPDHRTGRRPEIHDRLLPQRKESGAR